MTPEPTPLVTVLPCDRLAAARLDGDMPESMAWRMYIEGRCDAQYDVQLFARHRLAALEAAAKHFESLADMLDKRADEARDDDTARNRSESARMHRANAAIIRALSNKGGRNGE